MALISLRIRSNIPIVLMGETGIGKTALVELLATVMETKIKTFNIHAGITDS